MWPWGHLAVGYLLFSAIVRLQSARRRGSRERSERDGGEGANGRPWSRRPPALAEWVDARGRPTAVPAVVVALGTQLPDLVDKPLGWDLGLLPGGRTLAHSLLTAGLVLGALAWVARDRRERGLVLALALGWISHSLSDVDPALLAGRGHPPTFLAWPLLGIPESMTGSPSVLAHLSTFDPALYEAVQIGLFVLAVLAWYADGAPGTRTLVAWVPRAWPRE